jgi:hypothetical protein
VPERQFRDLFRHLDVAAFDRVTIGARDREKELFVRLRSFP